MCRSIKFSKLINILSVANSDIKADKYSKLIEISSQLCHEKIGGDRIRIKTINDLLKKQKLGRQFTMYIDLYFDNEKNLILIDYPFYPLKKEVSPN